VRCLILCPFLFSILVLHGYMISTYLLFSLNFLNNLSYSYDVHFKFCFYYCVLCDAMNKTRSHLHIF
jgi:hypothetical protein